MTREQTISNLKKLKSFHNGSYGADIDRAIKALEQESEDAISRQATIDTLLTERKKLDSCMQKCLENNQMSLRALNKAERNRIEEDIYIIKNLPPVTPQPKTGHWIDLPFSFECSECGIIRAKETSGKYNFCPHCGARMIEPQESEDKEKLSWLGKNCKDCGNEKCKSLGTLPKGHDCALWQAESEDKG